jgi:hypothetical protein
MKQVLVALAIVAASLPLVGLAQASPSIPPCGVCRPVICLSCVQCATSEVIACVTYDSFTGCAEAVVGYRTLSGTLSYATPGVDDWTSPVNAGPVHVGSIHFGVDSIQVINMPYGVAGREVSDTICSGPAQTITSTVLS